MIDVGQLKKMIARLPESLPIVVIMPATGTSAETWCGLREISVSTDPGNGERTLFFRPEWE